MHAIVAAALVSIASLVADRLKITHTSPSGEKTVLTEGKELTDGTNGTDNQSKAVDAAIGLLEDLEACIPAGDPNADPPVPPFGGAPGAEPGDGIDALDTLKEDGKIGYDPDLGKRPGQEGTTAATSPGEDGTLPNGDGSTTTYEGSDGMNISRLPLSTNDPAADGNPAFGEFPKDGGCFYSSNQMLELMLDLGHENTHLEDPRSLRDLPKSEVEGPVITAENQFLCTLADCLDPNTGNGGGETATTFFSPPERTIDSICKKLLQNNKRLKELGEPQQSCPKCPNNGLCPDDDDDSPDPANDGHPSNDGGDSEDTNPPEYCGWSTNRRLGYYHTSSTAWVGLNELAVSIDQADEVVSVELSGLDYPTGDESVVIDCSNLAVSEADGPFAPMSVAATSAHSIIVGGYAKHSGKGVFISFRFRGAGAGQPVLVSQDILYVGCDFTYPVCLGHNAGDALAYFFDRDRQVLGAIDLNSGTPFEMANAADHPQLLKTLYLVVGRYRDDVGVHGVLLSASGGVNDGSPMTPDPENPVFNLADTDRDLRLDHFFTF